MKSKKIILLGMAIALISGCSRSYEFYLDRGIESVKLEKHERAVRNLTKAIRLNSESEDAYFWRGRVFIEMGKYDDAIVDFTMAISLNSGEAYNYYWRAIAYRGLGKYETAIIDFNNAIKINNIDEFYFRRGITYESLGKIDLAIDDYSTVIELNENFPHIYLRRAAAYIFVLSDAERGKSDVKKSIEINPNDLGAYVLLTVINMLEGQMELALENLNHVIVNNPDYFNVGIGIQKGMIYFLRAGIFAYFNNHDKAIADLKIAADMGHELAREGLKRYGIDYP